MKLTKKLTTRQFILSHLLILVICLSLLAWLYYMLNIEHQAPKNPFLSGPVTTSPKSLRLDLDQPADDLLTFQSSLIISGQTTPFMNILISTSSDDKVITSKIDGSFSTILNLDEGVNTITAVVFDTTGESRSQQRIVYFSKEKI